MTANKNQLPLNLGASSAFSPMRAKANLTSEVHLGFKLSMGRPEAAMLQTHILVVGVVDTSGSMMGWKIRMVINAAKRMAKKLREIDYLAVISFNESAEVVLEPTLMNADGKKKAEFALNDLTADGGTFPITGFQMARRMLEGVTNKRVIVYLGDGQSSDRSDNDMDIDDPGVTLQFASQIRDSGGRDPIN